MASLSRLSGRGKMGRGGVERATDRSTGRQRGRAVLPVSFGSDWWLVSDLDSEVGHSSLTFLITTSKQATRSHANSLRGLRAYVEIAGVVSQMWPYLMLKDFS